MPLKVEPIQENNLDGFLITNPIGKQAKIFLTEEFGWSTGHNLFNFSKIADSISSKFVPFDYGKMGNTKKERGKYGGTVKYYRKIAEKAINKTLSPLLKKLIKNKVPEDLLLVHKTAFTVLGPKVYERYGCEIWSDYRQQKKEDWNFFVNDIKNGYKYAVVYFMKSREFYSHSNISDWMKIFTRGEPANSSLTKTLLHCPRIPMQIFLNLAPSVDGKLPKVFTDSLELKLWLAAISKKCHRINGYPFVNSSRKQIFKAKKLVEIHLRQKLDFRKFKDIINFTDFLCDFSNHKEDFQCQLVGLANKSVKWHIKQRQVKLERDKERIKADILKETKKPSVPLPKNEKILFLENVHMIIQEGEKMGHCVASYAERAIRGQCFLFHVEHGGEEATIEVLPEGTIQQARGPYNKENGACRWGSGVLKRWVRDSGFSQNSKQIENSQEYEEVPF